MKLKKLFKKILGMARITKGILGAILVAGILIGIYSYLFPKNIEAAWFNESWGYRTPLTVTISSSASDITDLDTLITLDTSTPIAAGKMQSSCQDLRFTNTKGDLLPYYIDSGCNGASTKIWVRADLVPKSTTTYTMYVYYGNPSATPGSDSNKFNLYNGLVGYWPMNEASWNGTSGEVKDTSVNSNNGTAAGDATTTASGKYSYGGTFDGTGDYVEAADNNSLDLSGSSLTLSFWIKPVTWSTNDSPISKKTNDNSDGYVVYYDGNYINKINFRIRGASGDNLYLYSTASVDNGTWQQWSVAYDKDTSIVKWYKNGILDATYTGISVGTMTNTAPLHLGHSQTWGGYSDGSLDDVRIYNRALSSSEVAQLYNTPGNIASTSTTTSKPTTSSGTEEKGPGPVGYWSFDEGQGSAAQDKSSNKNNGTISGATWVAEDQCVSGKCLKFTSTSSSKVTLASTVTGIQSVGFWVNPKTTSESIMDFDGGTHKVSIASGVVTATGFSSPTIYVNGKTGSSPPTVSANTWSYIEITTGTSFDGTSVKFGYDNTTYFNGFLDEVKIYSYARSNTQIYTDFNARGSVQGSSTVIASEAWQSSLSNGLVGYWKMDEASANTCTGGVNDSCDSSGNGNDGAWNGDATSAAGKFGNGVTFDGTGDYIDAGTNATLKPNVITVAGWYKPNSLGTTQTVISNRTNGNIFDGYVLVFNSSNKAVFYITTNGSSWVSITSDNALVNGNWYHIVGVYDGSVIKMFVNGVQQSSTPAQTGNIHHDLTASLHIGSDGLGIAGAEYYFNGSIDETRVYNRALSPKEVSDLYNWAPGPVGYWKMDDKVKGASKTIVDSSGYGNNGTTYSANGTGMDCVKSPGKYGGACEFDGTDDYVRMTTTGLYTNTVTLEAWTKTSSTKQYQAVLGSDITEKYEILFKTGSYPAQIEVSLKGNNYAQWHSALPKGQWTHIAVVAQNGIQWKLYLNGVDKGTPGSFRGTYQVDGTGVSFVDISKMRNSADFIHAGLIDEVKIYNYARTQKQIVEDMNAGHPAVGSPVGSALIHLDLDEGYSTAANNKGFGGSSKNGTINSGTWTNSGKFGKGVDITGSSGSNISIPDFSY